MNKKFLTIALLANSSFAFANEYITYNALLYSQQTGDAYTFPNGALEYDFYLTDTTGERITNYDLSGQCGYNSKGICPIQVPLTEIIDTITC